MCGYGELQRPPTDFAICPCCGTEFNYDDYALSYDELRHRWIVNGAKWFSEARPMPNNWNPYVQLFAAGLIPPNKVQNSGVTVVEKILTDRKTKRSHP